MIYTVTYFAGGTEAGATTDKTEQDRVSFPSTSSSISLNPEKKQQYYEIVSSKSQEMAYKFQKLFTTTRKSLREEKVPVPELVGHLECLGLIKPTFKDTIAGRSPMPLRHQLPKLAASETVTVEDVMSVVKDYCSFFNYHMLEHIIDEFGTPQDKDNLKAYKEDFNAYAQCCVVGSSEVDKMIEGDFPNVVVILDDSFDDCTLSHLNMFIADLRKALKLSSDVKLRLCYINRGSIKLTFQLLENHIVQKCIFPLSPKQEALLAGLGVVELSCGDYRFTRQWDKVIYNNNNHTHDYDIIIVAICYRVSLQAGQYEVGDSSAPDRDLIHADGEKIMYTARV